MQNNVDYSQCNDIYIKHNIPNDIIYIILNYKNSIVAVDSDHDNGQEILMIDTYGKKFDYYPKVLNWSGKERNVHVNYILSLNQDVAQCWLDYFAKKKSFGQCYDSNIQIDQTQSNSINSNGRHCRLSLFENM